MGCALLLDLDFGKRFLNDDIVTNDIPEFSQYANSRIFSRLADIREFNLVAEIPPVVNWSDDLLARLVVYQMYEYLRDVVKEAGFFFEDQLRAARELGGVAVEYDDDRFNFGVLCASNTIVIRRRGSRLSNFHDWYKSFMPSSQGLLTKAVEILSNATGRKIDILTASFRFNFLIYDIQADTTGRRVRNSEIIQKLLKGFPDDQGMITDSPNVLGSLGRVDVDMTRWIGEGDRRRLQFSVQAPGNQGYSTLWYSFGYLGESYTSPETGQREPFNPNQYSLFSATSIQQFLQQLR